jgi:geranylgeranyl pyrophosphate synthase
MLFLMSGDVIEVMRGKVYNCLDASLPSGNRVADAERYSVLDVKGSLWRPVMTCAVGLDYHVSIEKIASVAAAQECAHVASLILDDIQDRSMYRRGRESCYHKYGESTAQLAVIDLLVQGRNFIRAANISNIKKSKIIFESDLATTMMVHGQEMDNHPDSNPKAEKIIEMYARKSGALFALSAAAGGITGGASEGELKLLRRIGYRTGVCYQIGDDFADREEDARSNKKTLLTVAGINEAKRLWAVYEGDLRGDLMSLAGTTTPSFLGDIIARIIYHNKHIIDTT